MQTSDEDENDPGSRKVNNINNDNGIHFSPETPRQIFQRLYSTSTFDERSHLISSLPLDDFEMKRDMLTVFQAAPLAYRDLDGNVRPIGMLDFQREREILSDALKEAETDDARVDVSFKAATTDRLGAFLAKSESQVLHFSCHGHPEYLFVEDGWGAGQVLYVNDLKELIQAGGSNLRFVFVSACHSRSAGEAFLDAGVPHVVCCQQDSQQVRNTAAVEFARAFYRALACGRTLKEAFELGKKGVQHSPSVVDAANEMNKFALLPEDGDHDMPIFFTKPLPSKFVPKRLSLCRTKTIPVPPQTFVGRDVEVFRIIDALRTTRIVRVSGGSGSGKCSTVKAACQYMSERDLMDDIFWLPIDYGTGGGNIVAQMSKLFEEFQDENPAFALSQNRTYKCCRDGILDELREKKALLIFDARQIVLTEGIKKLIVFLEALFEGTRQTKVIVVHNHNVQIVSSNFSCGEDDIELTPLDYKSSVVLFSSLCRRGGDSDELCSLLLQQQEAATGTMTHRTSEIYKMLGEGNPAKINEIAKALTASGYSKLVAMARRPAPTMFKTRAALEKALEQVEREIEETLQSRNYHRAGELQESLAEMSMLRDSLPDLATLTSMTDKLRLEREQAVNTKEYPRAWELQQELNSLLAKKKLEEEALPIEKIESQNNPLCCTSRAELEENIRLLEHNLKEACANRNYSSARSIDKDLSPLKLQRDKLPTSTDLTMKIRRLKSDVDEAASSHDWNKAESIDRTLVDLEKKLIRERYAEAKIAMARQTEGLPAVSHSGPMNEEDPVVNPRDPPGVLMIGKNENDMVGSDEPPIDLENESQTATNHAMEQEVGFGESIPHGGQSRPGAFAISGPASGWEHDEQSSCQNSGRASREATANSHLIPRTEQCGESLGVCGSVQDNDVHGGTQNLERNQGSSQESFSISDIHEQIQPVAVPVPGPNHFDDGESSCLEIPQGHDSGLITPFQETERTESDDAYDPSDIQVASPLPAETIPTQDMRVSGQESERTTNEGVHEPLALQVASPSSAEINATADLRVSERSRDQRQDLGETTTAQEEHTNPQLRNHADERHERLVLSLQRPTPDVFVGTKRKGFCPFCGVKTHRRKRAGILRFKWEPITAKDVNDEYTVYKGACMGPLCDPRDKARSLRGGKIPQNRDPYDLPTLTTVNSQSQGDSYVSRTTARTGAVPTNARRYCQDLDSALSSNTSFNDRLLRSERRVIPETNGEQQEELLLDERSRIEEVVREVIAGLTVTATDVETVLSSPNRSELRQKNRRQFSIPNLFR